MSQSPSNTVNPHLIHDNSFRAALLDAYPNEPQVPVADAITLLLKAYHDNAYSPNLMRHHLFDILSASHLGQELDHLELAKLLDLTP